MFKTSQMYRSIQIAAAVSALCAGFPALAQDGLAKPNMVLRQTIEGMPKGDKQDIHVLTAAFKPGDKTVFHTHRFPVTVYVLEGAFTLELEGQAPLTVKAGESYVEAAECEDDGI